MVSSKIANSTKIGSQSTGPNSQQAKRPKSAKGTVAIQVFKDRLRLCWTYQSKRYFLYLGLPDSKLNRTVAAGKARTIEGDMATDNFDLTLAKYKPEHQTKSQIKVTEPFEKFIQRKPYTTRSTLISHALDMGMNPAMIAEMTGHDIQTLFRHYAGNVQGRPRLPDLMG
jgi:hypothetical protein